MRTPGFLQGRLNSNLPGSAWLLGVEPGVGFDFHSCGVRIDQEGSRNVCSVPGREAKSLVGYPLPSFGRSSIKTKQNKQIFSYYSLSLSIGFLLCCCRSGDQHLIGLQKFSFRIVKTVIRHCKIWHLWFSKLSNLLLAIVKLVARNGFDCLILKTIVRGCRNCG